jgi:hypothetical protein
MKLKTILLLLLFFELCFAQNVIVVVIDGARYTETFGAGATYIPHIYNDLKPIGAVYTNFRIADAGITSTNPGHASILTGTWQQILNDGSQRPTKPTVFEYFRQELGISIGENYVIAGKSKLDVISYSTDPAYGFNYRASESCSTLTDNQVYNNLVTIMDTYHPRLMIVNLPDTDLRGHANDWNGYLSAITNADNLVYQLWQKIQTDSFYQNNTTLFVTNDHGRHDTAHGGFVNHGDDCEGCEHIMLLAVGRNVSSGLVNNDLHYQIELAATVGDLLNFSTPQAIGTSLYEGTNPLPVELAFFSAIVLENSVKLNWRTETEVCNYGFEILRAHTSTPLSVIEWELLGFVEGHGNSNSPKDYSFIDQNVSGGKYSYRLKQIDTDGQFEYSKVIEVDAGNIPGGFVLEQNYPNPFNPTTTIKFALAETQKAELKVFDVLGNEVASLFNGVAEGGKIYERELNGESLSSGIYFYRLETDSKVENRKMILLK